MINFIKSASTKSEYVETTKPEICFVGRSNVGKSSLINALFKTKVSRTSKTPGRTQLINFFEWNDISIVDLPGYGFSAMPKKEQMEMLERTDEYISSRDQIKLVFSLVDAKVGPTKDDIQMISFLKETGRNFVIILTKGDKPNQKELSKTKKRLKDLEIDNFLITSSSKNQGLKEVKSAINALSILNVKND